MTSQETRPNGSSRDALIAAILQFLGGEDLLTLGDVREALEREIDAAGPDALLALKGRLASDNGWEYYPPDPLARGIHHLLADRFLHPDSRLLGTEHLATIAGAPVTIFANHLSYADANVVDVMLRRCGGAAIADRLTAIAGPKVFTSRERRFSSLCFGTVKVPQSAEVAADEAVLNARDVARAARRAIAVAHARLAGGDALLLFGEGTRSRTAEMQRLLPAVARYLEVPGAWALFAGLTGPEALFPVGEPTLRPAQVVMQFGRPIRADALLAAGRGNRRIVMDAIGLAIAEQLPLPYRGVYGDGDQFPEARSVLEAARTTA